jgi:hypothetical protein
VERRIDFARNLHYGEDYDLALEVCDAVLGDFPGHAGALALEGDIYFEAWIRAVSFEAAHAIGHPEEAATLSKTQIAALQHLGGRSWVERLVNEYGLHPSSPRLARRAAQLDRRERDERYTWRR